MEEWEVWVVSGPAPGGSLMMVPDCLRFNGRRWLWGRGGKRGREKDLRSICQRVCRTRTARK